jgi:hypothetical protein
MVKTAFRGEMVETNKVVCDGRLLASFVVDSKHLVEVVENELAGYWLENGVYKLRRRGQKAK